MSKKVEIMQFEKGILNWISKNITYIVTAVAVIVSVIIRHKARYFVSSDMRSYNLEWFYQLRCDGGFAGIKNYSGDYNYLYITMLAVLTYIPKNPVATIKMMSYAFDYLLAYSTGKLAYIISGKKQKAIFAFVAIVTLFLPTVIVNASFWGQCDSMYVSFCVLALCSLIEERYFRAYTYLGIAFAFKLQAIFILPIFIIVYLKRRNFSILFFLWAFLSTMLVSLPGMILSNKGLKGFFDIYFGQMGQGKYLTENFPNIYYWLPLSEASWLRMVGVLFTIIVLALASMILINKGSEMSPKSIVEMALWTSLCCVYFLPNMRDRYSYLAEALCIVWASQNKKWAWYPAVIIVTTMSGYLQYLFGYLYVPIFVMSFVNIGCFIAFSVNVFSNKKE